MNLGRMLTISANVFRETIRDRVLYLVGFYALLMGFAIRILPEVAASTEDKMIADFGIASMSILGLLVAVIVGAGLINQEIEKQTLLILLAKPISKGEFILGKHLGLSAAIAVLVTLMSIVYTVSLQIGQIPYSLASIAIALLFLLLELFLLSAVALTLGVFTSSLLATLMSLAVYLMGHFSQDLVALGQLSENSDIERLTQTLYLVLPDLARLDLKNQVVYGLLPDFLTLLTNAGYGLLYTALLLILAISIFSRRQF